MTMKFYTLLFVALFYTAAARASAAVSAIETNACGANEGQCAAAKVGEGLKTSADEVLDEAARLKDLTAENVHKVNVIRDPNVEEARVPEKKGDAFKKVFTTAFRQWIATDGTPSETVKGSNPATKRAIEEVQRRKGEPRERRDKVASGAQKKLSDLEDDMGESEIFMLENAVRRLLKSTMDNKLKDLDFIEHLCHSGDNGNHFESIGGVKILLNLIQSESNDSTRVLAVKALATCAQNNPTVFNRAVSDGAVNILVQLADETDNVAIRASALRALVSLRESDATEGILREEQDRLLRIVKRSLELGVEGKDERRSVLRGLALVEPFLKSNASVWVPAVWNSGIVEWCLGAVSNPDVDVRESAALFIKTAESYPEL